MERIKCVDKASKQILIKINEKRKLVGTIHKKIGNCFGHVVRGKILLTSFLEDNVKRRGEIEGSKESGSSNNRQNIHCTVMYVGM